MSRFLATGWKNNEYYLLFSTSSIKSTLLSTAPISTSFLPVFQTNIIIPNINLKNQMPTLISALLKLRIYSRTHKRRGSGSKWKRGGLFWYAGEMLSPDIKPSLVLAQQLIRKAHQGHCFLCGNNLCHQWVLWGGLVDQQRTHCMCGEQRKKQGVLPDALLAMKGVHLEGWGETWKMRECCPTEVEESWSLLFLPSLPIMEGKDNEGGHKKIPDGDVNKRQWDDGCPANPVRET